VFISEAALNSGIWEFSNFRVSTGRACILVYQNDQMWIPKLPDKRNTNRGRLHFFLRLHLHLSSLPELKQQLLLMHNGVTFR